MSDLVRNPEDRYCRDAAHMIVVFIDACEIVMFFFVFILDTGNIQQ